MTRDERARFEKFVRENPKTARDIGAAAALAALRAPAVPGEADGCLNCAEKHDGGYCSDEGNVGPFCEQCWHLLRDQFAAPPAAGAPPAEGSPLPLEHTRSCGALTGRECTCGLAWRIRLATEQEMHAAWRKRAEEAETRENAGAPPALVALAEKLVTQCRVVLSFAQRWEPLTPGDLSDLRKAADAVDAALQSLGSPAPAPVAPPAGVSGSAGIDWQAERDRCAFPSSPAPAPVAPPAGVPECPAGQHSYRRNAPPQPGDVCFVCRKSIWMPAPSAVAGGDAPEKADDVCECGHTRSAHAWTYHGRCQCHMFRRRQEGQ